MVSLSTKRRGVAVVAVLTVGLLFGIALLMMRHSLPISETNFSTGTTVSMTLYTRYSSSNSETPENFLFKNTANAKVVQIFKIDDPVPVQGQSKTVSLALDEKLGQLFCLCAFDDESWDGELTGFMVNDVIVNGVVSLKLSRNDLGYYPCWRFGIEAQKLVDKGPGQGCSVSKTVSMTLRTLNTRVDSNTDDDLNFVNTAKTKVVSQYEVSQPGRIKGGSKTVSLAMNEELGDLFCLCTAGDDAWDGELTDFKVVDVSFPGVVTSLKLSTDEPGYSPCWRFGIDSEKLVDKGPSNTCAMSTSVWMELYTTDQSYQDLKFVNVGKVVTQYDLDEPGYNSDHYTRLSLTLNEELGHSFCLCAISTRTWAGRLTGLKVDGVSFSGLSTTLKLSMHYSDYYPCWRFGIESNELVDKGHSWQCSLSTKAWIQLYTKPNTNARTGDDFMFVSTDNVTVLEQYELTQPGRVEGESTITGVALNGDLGLTFCLCQTGDDAWDGEIQQINVYGVTFVGAVDLKLSTNDSGYYPCWRLGIDEESKMLVDKGHSDSCI